MHPIVKMDHQSNLRFNKQHKERTSKKSKNYFLLPGIKSIRKTKFENWICDKKRKRNVRYLDAKRGEFEDALNGEEEGEEIVEVDEDVHEVQGRPLELEHEQEGVEDDELG